MTGVIWTAAVFLVLSGVMFLAAPFLPRALSFAAAARRTLELNGRFEAIASVLSGVFFLAAGGVILVNLDQSGG